MAKVGDTNTGSSEMLFIDKLDIGSDDAVFCSWCDFGTETAEG